MKKFFWVWVAMLCGLSFLLGFVLTGAFSPVYFNNKDEVLNENQPINLNHNTA